ncbi:NUDIX domain-containing protein [Sphingomonas sp. CROZ-RG-20F-R02-07]|uniref:NUDIX hydrolase n=1 Tax=Sphingomonas sp. CROZ-RG-20F-R02-07 TaxID=2914832 RepID=UPI001F57CE07|nr:NUDIX domain-containing protein [Sphingomonas sp. CROZ-RG-20F-R02-07]
MTLDAPPVAIPAATLVILRARAGAPPDLLMVERARAMAFAGGALVFPGGRVDSGDHALAQRLGSDDAEGETAARIAAIRETIEEAGVPMGLSPMPAAATLDRLRADLADGMAFAEALDRAGCAIDPAVLVAFARWRPAHRASRIFDTRFYLVAWPDGLGEPQVDRTENVRLLWASAATVLADADAGRVAIIYPTRRNLERLARFAGFAAAAADAAAHPVRTITPFEDERDGVRHLCIPEGLGYPVTSEPFDQAVRG